MYKDYEIKLNAILDKHGVQKVELGLSQDLVSYSKELDKGIDYLMQQATDAREAIAKGVREMDRLDAVYRVAKKIRKDVAKSAIDIGISVNKIPEVKQVDQMIKAYEQQKKSLKKVLK
jgi:hypothetical protein